MNRMTKILIAYDGSKGSDEMLTDLRCAGLPPNDLDIEALVVSIGEGWFLLSLGSAEIEPGFGFDGIYGAEEALRGARQASERIKSDFPAWNVQCASAIGSPARVLIEKADEWKPDLLILGSHSHTAAERFFFGSVSQTVVSHSHCSVRVARAGRKRRVTAGPHRHRCRRLARSRSRRSSRGLAPVA